MTKHECGYAVIPKTIRYNSMFTDFEVRLITEISTLSHSFGFCFASNKWLAQALNKSPAHISRVISKLEKQGLFRVEVVKLENGHHQRRIFVGAAQEVTAQVIEPVGIPACTGGNAPMHTPLCMEVNAPTHPYATYIDINSKSNSKFKRESDTPAFKPPTINEVLEFAKQQGAETLAQKFYLHFTTPAEDPGKHWIDSEGKRVLNWQQKFLSWKNRERDGPVSQIPNSKKMLRHDPTATTVETNLNEEDF